MHSTHGPDLVLHGMGLRHENPVLVPYHPDGTASVQNENLIENIRFFSSSKSWIGLDIEIWTLISFENYIFG